MQYWSDQDFLDSGKEKFTAHMLKYPTEREMALSRLILTNFAYFIRI